MKSLLSFYVLFFSLIVFSVEPEKHQVVIIGGGLTGLVAGYELTGAGHDVLVLEAKDTVGGRVATHRFENGQYAELGATRVPDNHERLHHYIKKFNLPLAELPLGEPKYETGNSIYTDAAQATEKLKEQLTPAERELGLKGLTRKYIDPALEDFNKIKDWRKPSQIEKYDKITMKDYLKNKGASEAAIELLMHSQRVYLDSSTPASYWLAESKMMSTWNKTYMIAGGNDQLPKAFAKALGNKVRTSAPVREIIQKGDKVIIRYGDKKNPKEVEADFVISSLPMEVLKWLKFVPELSPEKKKALAELKSEPSTRINFQTDERVWVGTVPHGLRLLSTDKPGEKYWDMTLPQKGKEGIITSYSSGPHSVFLSQLAEEDRNKKVWDDFRHAFPRVQERPRAVVTKVWHDDEYARGGWLSPTTGQIGGALAAMDDPEGRVFFASDDLSHFVGWMEGALESGQKAAGNVHSILPLVVSQRKAYVNVTNP